jgi:hypothetical protein
MQHELQRRACDFVFIDDKNPALIDGFGTFHTDLHVALQTASSAFKQNPFLALGGGNPGIFVVETAFLLGPLQSVAPLRQLRKNATKQNL